MNSTSLMVGRDDESASKLRHLLHLSETASDEQILNIVKESNNIQVMLKLRKSRWNKNEVEYAEFLIEEFDSGYSKNLKTGHTKRSYLSDKLMCAPMRVSKKFPGKSIGKTAFSRTSTGPDGDPIPGVVLERYELRHKALRIQFLRKILLAELKIMLDNTKVPMSNANSCTAGDSQAKTTEMSSQMIKGPISVQAEQVNAISLLQRHMPIASTIKPVPCMAPPTKMVPLHIERKLCAPSPAGPPLFLQRAVLFDKPAVPQGIKPKSILSTVKGSRYGNTRTEQNDIPDLLSGFDKHAASLQEQKGKYVSISVPISVPPEQTSSNIAAHVPSEHPLFVGPIGTSPYITSKSFDDLHQCLANNQIPHLDIGIGHSVKQQDEHGMRAPVPPVACGVPIQVTTNNCPSEFNPYTHQQNNTQPVHMVSFMPQFEPQIAHQSIPAQQIHNVAALPMFQKSGHVAEDEAQKSFIYNHQNGTHLQFSNDAVAATTLVGGRGGGETNKRSHIEQPGLTFTSKRFKPSHSVSTASGSSEPSSSDGGFDSERVLSSYENSKQASNNSDSSETD
eukprot:scaffold67_cov155-Skeletonema_menzelii.AAC.48